MSLDFLPRRVKAGEAITASAFNAVLDELRRLGSMHAGNGLSLRSGASGWALGVSLPPTGPIKAIVATGGLSARVSGTELGVGNAVLWPRTAGAATPAAGATVTVYNPYNVAVPAAHTVVVLPDDAGGYLLVGADCIEV